eukprot:TRINITY_DN37904_c0_g1_i1.p1 TRINITY_DN37904_c0_g1~~TRINITY_DN37904_c0_g1_i1.p1  ORF type:complete len:201 (+),score=45.21 TRINITY_DN37904_c0_g1_i1:52-654(+)
MGRKQMFAVKKRILNKDKEEKKKKANEAKTAHRSKFSDQGAADFAEQSVKRVQQVQSNMYLRHNMALGPPYRVLVDTNFINFSMQNKIDIIKGCMDCLYAKVDVYICSCVIAELEKLGDKFKVALKTCKDPRFKRLTCGTTYADDCIVNTVSQFPVYIVATADKDLKRRLRKIPGVPIMYISKHRYTVERLPDAYGAPRE